MTRIAPSPMPGLEPDRTIDRTADRAADQGADRAADRAPPTPFRAALRKADKAVARIAAGAPPAPLAPPPAMAASAPRPRARDSSHGAHPGSIADVIASSTDPSAAPLAERGSQPAGEPGAESATRPPGAPAACPARGPAGRAARAPGPDAADDAGLTPTGDGLLDATLASTGLVNPAVTGAPPSSAVADLSDSPVSAWVAAAVARAVGSLGGAASAAAVAASAANAADATDRAASAPAVIANPGIELAVSALSPLEQAVHDLIGRAAERDRGDPRAAKVAAAPDAASIALHVLTAGSTQPADVRAPAGAPVHGAEIPQLPEPPANPSHVHLVLDDGPERTVVTVAVRGNEVRVALRANDDATSAALARNAASLDHAMRARGLALGELTTEREPRDQRPPRDPEPRERRSPDAEPFVLEEKP